MSETEKRKEKPKRNSRRFIGLSIFLIIVLLIGVAWILSILLRPDPIVLPSPMNTSQMTVIAATNDRLLTQISDSATEASNVRATHEVIRTDAAATLEQAQATAYYSPIQQTATALDCWCVWDLDDQTSTAIARTEIAATNAVATESSIGTVEVEITSTMIYLQETETALPLWFYETPTPSP